MHTHASKELHAVSWGGEGGGHNTEEEEEEEPFDPLQRLKKGKLANLHIGIDTQGVSGLPDEKGGPLALVGALCVFALGQKNNSFLSQLWTSVKDAEATV